FCRFCINANFNLSNFHKFYVPKNISKLSKIPRALNTLRYIHANPKAAGVQQGLFYDFSNYGVHDRLGDDGITTWHPAFLSLGRTLDECATKYRGFCKKYC
ncbi:MAG: transposase, partial [Dolichospermum sp.]